MVRPTAHALDPGRQIIIAALATTSIVLPWMMFAEPMAPLLIVVGALSIGISIAYPGPICLAFVGFSYFRIHEAFPFLFHLRIPFFLAGLTAVSLAWNLFISGKIKSYWTVELRAGAILFALVSAGIVFAADRRLAFEHWSSSYWKIVMMMFAIAWLTRTVRDFDRWAKLILICGILVALVAIRNKFSGIGLVEFTRVTIGRDLGSLLGDPNDLALILLLPLSMAGALILCRSGTVNTTLAFLGLPLILAAIAFTQSRGGFLAVLATALVLSGHYFRSWVLGCVVVIAVSLGLYGAMDLSDRFYGTRAGEVVDASAQGRLDAWMAALRMAEADPLTGVGIANFGANLYRYGVKSSQEAHSSWFGVLAETGLPGFLAFVVMFVAASVSCVFTARRLKNAHAPPIARALGLALSAGLAGYAVAGSFLSHGFSWPLYVLVGLSAAIHRYAGVHYPAPSPTANAPHSRVFDLYNLPRRTGLGGC